MCDHFVTTRHERVKLYINNFILLYKYNAINKAKTWKFLMAFFILFQIITQRKIVRIDRKIFLFHDVCKEHFISFINNVKNNFIENIISTS